MTTYLLLEKDAVTKTQLSPTISQYNTLLLASPSGLTCPCEHASIGYREFTTLNVTYHQVCSSEFISEEWIDFLFGDVKWHRFPRKDMRIRAGAYFRLLSILCQLGQETVTKSVDEFLSRKFFTSEVTSENQLFVQMNQMIQQLQTSISQEFSSTIQLVGDFAQANTFVSSYNLNWNHRLLELTANLQLTPMPVLLNGLCSCAFRSDCSEAAMIMSSSSDIDDFVVSGWKISCSVLETLLQSSLECFFTQDCLDLFLIHYNLIVTNSKYYQHSLIAMNQFVYSRFNISIPIRYIVNELFIEEWHSQLSYDNYYQQCKPSQCSYKVDEKRHIIMVVTRLLGLYGGLRVSLRLVSPRIMSLFFRIENFFLTKLRISTRQP